MNGNFNAEAFGIGAMIVWLIMYLAAVILSIVQ